ncbi:MAG: PD40 domain-containing protein [Candidatus Glassbacteria bacterium]|nr:PD40 domain-containing protein [Candidatus Glassbacteria bacterium]
MYHNRCFLRVPVYRWLIAALTLFTALPAAGEARWGAPFLRHPAPDPQGRRIAFSHGGDIWIVPAGGGAARRLTVHEAYDAYPVWSPRGDRIAFSSNRLGDPDIFVVDTLGAAVFQLTFRGAGDRPVDWSADGSEVIFVSLRDFSPRRITTPYRVPADGGRMPSKLWPVLAADVRLSPGGDKIAFTRGYHYWWRKGYTGSGNYDIWLYSPADGNYQRLTGLAASEHTPLWPSDERLIYYVSEYAGAPNLFRRALTAPPDEPGEAVTFFREDGVRWARISADGTLVAFERGTDVYTLFTGPGAEPKLLQVSLPADSRKNPDEWKTFTSGAESFAVSPDGAQAAVVVRGELFCVENLDDGYTSRLTGTVSRESSPCWMPDSTRLLFVCDSTGNDDIYLLESADTTRKKLFRTLKLKAGRLTDGTQPEHGPLPSPDGRTVAYVRGNGDLMLMDADGGNRRLLSAGWDRPQFCWSPDSRWIAFSRNDVEFNEDVWVVPADGSAGPVNLSRHPDSDRSPAFSADGRLLAFLSRRSQDNSDIYYVFLRREESDLSAEELRWREEPEKDGQKKGPPQVVIDFEDIHLRLRRVAALPADVEEFAVSPDGKTFVFSADTRTGWERSPASWDLYSITREGEDLTPLTSGGQNPSRPEYSPDGKTVYFLKKGGIPSSVSLADKKVKALPLAARMKIDHRAERVEVFEEAWRTINDYFYDPQFHGADWQAMRRKYLPAVRDGSCAREDFDDLVRLMLGELNGSHLGISPPGSGLPGVQAGALGVQLDEGYAGSGFRVEYVFRRGPADRHGSRLNPGDVILAVDGRPVQPGDNLFRLLYDTVDRPVALEVRPAGGKKTVEVVIRPVSTGRQRDLVYEDWVDRRRRMVDSLSSGQLAYLHIRAMNQPSFEQFEQELYSEAHGKKGLLVDVRNNGGGWITDYLLAVLTVDRHAYTIPRGATEKGYPQDRLPVYSWVKPVAALCNELSFSNAEIFSHAFKTLGLGPLVGATTGGAVISTGGTTLIDGSVFRVPFRGWYVRGTDVNMERQGCVPDITVPEPPGEEGSGADSQLERAVQELLKLVQ